MKNFMKTTLISMSLTGILLHGASAQRVEELANQYGNLPQVDKLMTDMFSPNSMAAQFSAGLPPSVTLSDEKKLKIGTLMSTEMNKLRPRFKQLMIEGSAKTFNADELTALIGFYSSQHGASVLSKMQPFFQNVMAEMAPEIQGIQKNILPQLLEIIQEK